MSELWREWLYPLGFISTVAFGLRMLIQWLASEVKGRSSVIAIDSGKAWSLT